MKNSLVLAALAALSLACRTASEPAHVRAKEALPMEWKGQYGGGTTPRAVVIQEPGRWRLLWKELGQEEPAVDFTVNFALAVFLGQRTSGGYTVDFLEPKEKDDALVLPYREKQPEGFVTQVLSEPYAIRLYPKTTLKIRPEAVR
jgi:hypothetical protein